MKQSKALIVLSCLVVLFALVQAGAGLFWQTGGEPFPFTTLHGQEVQINGQGLYAYDTAFKAPIFRGTDAVSLFAGVPLLIVSILLYRRGSLRGGLALVGVLAYFLYNSASVALGAAYNNLFLLYIAYFSASLFAFFLAFNSLDARDLALRLGPGFPRRSAAVLMFVTGLALLAAWLGDILGALAAGGVPEIASYTTEVTYVFDLGVIAPLVILTGIQLLRRIPLSYFLAVIMLIVLILIGLVVTSQTIFQLNAGIDLPIQVFLAKAGSFMILAVAAAWLIFRALRRSNLPDPDISS